MTAVYFRYNQFREFVADCQATAGTATTDTALDFAWNDAQCTFATGTTTDITATAGSNQDIRFQFDGDKDQLRHRIVSWTINVTTANNSIGGGFRVVDEKKSALMEIFKKVPMEIIKRMSPHEKKLVKAKEKSEKLLKDVLSPKEYYGLVHKGEIEIPSKEDDIIFIIKKDPNEMIQVKKNGKEDHKLCIIASDPDMPVKDKLLSKILIVKTDEKQLRKIANRY